MFRSKVISSLRWSALGRFASQLVTWVITIIVIRILSPSDYGLMALATMFVGFFTVFEELGMSAAIIQKRDLDDTMIRKIFGLIIAFTFAAYLVIFLTAPMVAAFFDDPDLTLIIRVVAISMPVSALGAVPMALIDRALRFKQKSMVEFASAIAGSLVTLGFALTGFGVWSLVFGKLAMVLVQVCGYWGVVRRLYIPSFDLRAIGSELRFGGLVSLDRVIWVFYAQADVFFIGKFLGKETLGVYAVAMQLATLPMQKVVGILNQIGFAAFAKIQSDVPKVRENLLMAVGSLALIAFPVFFGISSVAPQISSIFLGDKWQGIELPLALLAIAVPLRLINATTPTMLYGLGRAGTAAQNSFLALLMLGPSFAMAAMWGGLVAVCLVWVIGYPVYYVLCLSRALPFVELPLRRYFRRLLPFAVGGLLMYAVVMSVSMLLGSRFDSDLLLLFVLIATGMLAYGGFMWAFARRDVVELYQLVKS